MEFLRNVLRIEIVMDIGEEGHFQFVQKLLVVLVIIHESGFIIAVPLPLQCVWSTESHVVKFLLLVVATLLVVVIVVVVITLLIVATVTRSSH